MILNVRHIASIQLGNVKGKNSIVVNDELVDFQTIDMFEGVEPIDNQLDMKPLALICRIIEFEFCRRRRKR